jgi:hypothetical protein
MVSHLKCWTPQDPSLAINRKPGTIPQCWGHLPHFSIPKWWENDEKCRHNEICRSFRVQWPRVNSHLSMAPRGCPKSSGSQDPRVPGKPRCSLASRGDGYLTGRDLTSHVTRMRASKENYPQITGRKFQLSEILQFTQICNVCVSFVICWKIWSI